MIKYSTNPGRDSKALTDSPVAPIQTKGGATEADDANDLDSEDQNS